MAVFSSTAMVGTQPLNSIIGTERLTFKEWASLQERVVQGGRHIMELRGRSSFQSPAYLSVCMMAAAMGGSPFRWPSGVYLNTSKYSHIVMAMETLITQAGIVHKDILGTPKEEEQLEVSYLHLCKMRQEVIDMGVLPKVEEWKSLNPNLG